MKTTIETRVRLRLDELGMKFGTFCDRVNISTVAMRNIFARDDCKVEDLKKMAEVLGVSISFLLGEGGDQTYNPDSKEDPNMEIQFLRTEIEYLKEIIKLKDELLQKPKP